MAIASAMPTRRSASATPRPKGAQRRGPRARPCGCSSARGVMATTALRRSLPLHGQRNSRPGDVRALRASQLAKDASGAAFFAERGKTGKPVGGVLNDRALAAMEAYLESSASSYTAKPTSSATGAARPTLRTRLGDDFQGRSHRGLWRARQAHPCRLSPERRARGYRRRRHARCARSRDGKHAQRLECAICNLLPVNLTTIAASWKRGVADVPAQRERMMVKSWNAPGRKVGTMQRCC